MTRGKAWDGAFQFTDATSDLQESNELEGPAAPQGVGDPRRSVPGKELFQFSPVGYMGDDGAGGAGGVQQCHEHVGGVCAEPVDLLTCLLGQAAHDPLAAANPESGMSATAHGHPGGTRGQGRRAGLAHSLHTGLGTSREGTGGSGWATRGERAQARRQRREGVRGGHEEESGRMKGSTG